MDLDLQNSAIDDELKTALTAASVMSKHQYRSSEWQVEITHCFSTGDLSTSAIKIVDTEYDQWSGEHIHLFSVTEAYAIALVLEGHEASKIEIGDACHILGKFRVQGSPYWFYDETTSQFCGVLHFFELTNVIRGISVIPHFSYTEDEGKAIALAFQALTP